MKNKGNSILEFVVVLPVFLLIFVFFLELGLIFYVQLKLDHASFSIQTQLPKEEDIPLILDQMGHFGFHQLEHQTIQGSSLVLLKHKHQMITPILSKLLNMDGIVLQTQILLE